MTEMCLCVCVCVCVCSVVAHVHCEVVRPFADRPTEGIIHFNAELSPMSSPAFDGRASSADAVQLNRLLERIFRETRAVDVESLVIQAGEKVSMRPCAVCRATALRLFTVFLGLFASR